MIVTPAKAGVSPLRSGRTGETPAFAGVTMRGGEDFRPA